MLLLTMHHIVSDGWSIGVLYRELKQLYEAFREGRPSPLEELPIQYGDFAAWQQRSCRGGMARSSSSPTGPVSSTTFRQAARSRRTGPARRFSPIAALSSRSSFDRQLIDRLKAFSRRENVTLFMTLLAAFKTLLFRYNGQDDCVVGVPIASRPQKELESLIGFFANTLVLRTTLAGDPSFVELLARVRSTALGAYAHQDVPLERIMESLRIARDLTRTPLFQVMFAFQNVPETADLGMRRSILSRGLPSISLPVLPRGPSGSTTRRRNSISPCTCRKPMKGCRQRGNSTLTCLSRPQSTGSRGSSKHCSKA